jgi:hypothetical protein
MRTLRSLLLLLLVISPALHAQWFDLQTAGIPRNADGSVDMDAPIPRDANGNVDFSGPWSVTNATGSIFDESNLLGWAIDAKLEAEETFYTQDPRFHCLPAGPSELPAGGRRIVQTPDYIAILHGDRSGWMAGNWKTPFCCPPGWVIRLAIGMVMT